MYLDGRRRFLRTRLLKANSCGLFHFLCVRSTCCVARYMVEIARDQVTVLWWHNVCFSAVRNFGTSLLRVVVIFVLVCCERGFVFRQWDVLYSVFARSDPIFKREVRFRRVYFGAVLTRCVILWHFDAALHRAHVDHVSTLEENVARSVCFDGNDVNVVLRRVRYALSDYRFEKVAAVVEVGPNLICQGVRVDATFFDAVLRDLSDEEGGYRDEFRRVALRVNANRGNTTFFFLTVSAAASVDRRFRFDAVRPFFM